MQTSAASTSERARCAQEPSPPAHAAAGQGNTYSRAIDAVRAHLQLPGSGLGVFLADGQKSLRSRQRAWWAPFRRSTFATIAEFPMSLALTADNILSQHEVRLTRWFIHPQASKHSASSKADAALCTVLRSLASSTSG